MAICLIVEDKIKDLVSMPEGANSSYFSRERIPEVGDKVVLTVENVPRSAVGEVVEAKCSYTCIDGVKREYCLVRWAKDKVKAIVYICGHTDAFTRIQFLYVETWGDEKFTTQ